MDLLELNTRIAEGRGTARVKVKITGPLDAAGCAEVTCVETITNKGGQIIIFSDERLE